MSSNELYVVTGASGRTGAAVANTLLTAGKRVRVIVRDEAKGSAWSNKGAEVAIADLTDIAALADAFAGAAGAYIMSPPQYTAENLFERADMLAAASAEAAIRAGLPKMVALSSLGAERPKGIGLIATNRMLEKYLEQTGLPLTSLRASYFMENWGTLAGAAIHGVLPSFIAPIDKKIPMVAAEDIGRTAAEILCEDWNKSRIVELEGPAMYSPQDVANAFQQALNKSVHAVPVPESEWAQNLSQTGLSKTAITGFIEMTQALNAGNLAFVNAPNIEHRKGTITLDSVIAAITAHQN